MSLNNFFGIVKGGIILIMVLISLAGMRVSADITAEFQTAGGYTDNLRFDTSAIDDTFGKAKLTLNLIPYSFMKIELINDYMKYDGAVIDADTTTEGDSTVIRYNAIDLSNNKTSVNIHLVPVCQDENFIMFIRAGFNTQSYMEGYEKFNNDNLTADFSLGYRLCGRIMLRSGFSFNSTDYTNEEDDDTATVKQTFDISGDNDTYEIFFGGNITLPWSNVIDFEGGYSKMNLTYARPPKDSILKYWDDFTWIPRDYLNPNKDTLIDGSLKSYYFSPRLSRPIGSKFGINITYIYRSFESPDDIIIAGLSNQFLSPWTSVYEGESVTGTIKSYILPNFIITAGAGYWKKDYLKGEEERKSDNSIPPPPRMIRDRHDEQNKFFCSIRKPLVFRSGLFIEPSFEINISHNNSSNDLYDYDNFALSLGLTMRK
nr:hypothetical protein [candidate division Zixibacteria bacterium]